MESQKLLDGKNVIVTGTARGIGYAMVEVFAQNGANIFTHARKETEEHKEYCESIAEKYNVTIYPIYFDMSNENEIKKGVQEIRSKKVIIDGLVNNAGITYNALFQMTNIAELRNQFEVNFFGPFLFTQYISKLMVRNGAGSIVNISSTAALDGNSGKSAYGASKSALLCMTMSIAEEMGVSGIRANVICPGVVATDMVETMPEYILDIQKEAACLGSIAKPKDIANTAVYLLSDKAKYVTGQVFRVDGGITNYAKRN